MTLRLVWGEEGHDAAVRPDPDGLRVTVDGREFLVRVREAAPGTFALEEGARRETFHCVRDGDEVHLFWRGVAYRLTREREGARAATRPAASGLTAPMPGKVIVVRAAAGQAVRKGDELLVIEAMKMENALRAPRDGVVKSVAARAGDMVSPGVVLVELQ